MNKFGYLLNFDRSNTFHNNAVRRFDNVTQELLSNSNLATSFIIT
jgi:hypothetical protein